MSRTSAALNRSRPAADGPNTSFYPRERHTIPGSQWFEVNSARYMDERNSGEDRFNIPDMMNFDGYMSAEELLASYNFFNLQSILTQTSYDQQSFLLPTTEINASTTIPMDLSTSNDSDGIQNSKIPMPLSQTLAEKMLWALSLLKGSSSGGILAQLWVPVRKGNQYVLSTCDQPFLLDQVLAGYREASRSYTFSIEEAPGSFPGLPGRVFMSKVPEWTSNVNYYNKAEYLRIKDAAQHEVRGSVAVPIFSSSKISCCAVLELVTTRAKSDFDLEIENVSHALHAVNLRTSRTPHLEYQSLSISQRSALSEITDVLRAVCHAHRLPLALIWIPCTVKAELEDTVTIRVRERYHLSEKSTLFTLENACYLNDRELQGFLHACVKHPLDEGQGVAGKALQSNLPFFFHDVKKYHISEYPLVHHARKFGLNAAVAIRLRSLLTGDDDYILEFFLPLNMTGTKEQQLFLDNLSSTMQRICRSLRTVSDLELVGLEGSGSYGEEISTCCVPPDSASLEKSDSQIELPKQKLSDVSSAENDLSKKKRSYDQMNTISRRLTEKKRTTAEKTVSLSVLQQYFSGSLKNAAKSIGVCPTTLKRICRQHGISRWPSRKINKVNRSLRKIQRVLNSVHGIDGGLKFDPTTNEFMTTDQAIGSVSGEIGSVKLEGPDEFTCTYENQLSFGTYKQPTNSSSMTELSNECGSMSSSPRKVKTKSKDGESRLKVVKVTYRDDTVRFKFDPSVGYDCLYEEVAKRFKLETMSFQFKYLDDEEEWVLLQSDEDLEESVAIMDLDGRKCVKILVCDSGSRVGSSELREPEG